jgi:hypothetical protein
LVAALVMALGRATALAVVILLEAGMPAFESPRQRVTATGT